MATKEEQATGLNHLLTELKTAVDNATIEVNPETKAVHLDEAEFKEISRLKKEINELKSVMESETEIKDIQRWLDGDSKDAPGAFGGMPEEAKDIASAFIESDEFKDMIQSRSLTMRTPFEVNRGDVAANGLYGTKASGTGGLYTNVGYSTGTQPTRNLGTVVQSLPLERRPQQPQRVRDLFPAASTSANVIEYFQSLGFVEGAAVPGNAYGGKIGNAQTVADYVVDATPANSNFGLKPKSTLQFRQANDPVRTIAHWTPAHRNILADVPQLKSVIQDELFYGLKLVEDAQLLSGNGSGENLLGLLNRPGIQTYTQAGTEQKTDAVRRAITKASLALYPASGIVMHPNDWEDVELQKADATSGAAGDGQYMVAQNVVVGAQARLWRLPVVETPVLTEGTFLVAAFGQACKLYDREQANLRISEHHEDFFVRNAIVMLVEERLGLSVPRPEGIVKGTFA